MLMQFHLPQFFSVSANEFSFKICLMGSECVPFIFLIILNTFEIGVELLIFEA